MTDDTQSDHYFHDADGHLWVDLTAVNNSDGFEILPVRHGAAEVGLSLTQFRITKGHPCLQAVLTEEADEKLGEIFDTDD